MEQVLPRHRTCVIDPKFFTKNNNNKR